MSLADEPLRDLGFKPDPDAPGRRLRVFARLVRCVTPFGTAGDGQYRVFLGNELLFAHPERPTYGAAIREATELIEAQAALSRLPLRQNCAGIPAMIDAVDQVTSVGRNPEVPDALQDLAEEIAIDVHEACAAFDNPDVWYPGVDDGIDPVADEHVTLVIASMQRELNRERRNALGQNTEPKLPPAPLDELPQRVQRALVERRRLRFAQYGIGRKQWESGMWSLWDVPEDSDWAPRRL